MNYSTEIAKKTAQSFVKHQLQAVKQETAKQSSSEIFQKQMTWLFLQVLKSEDFSVNNLINIVRYLTETFSDFPKIEFPQMSNEDLKLSKNEKNENFVIWVLAVFVGINDINWQIRQEIIPETKFK